MGNCCGNTQQRTNALRTLADKPDLICLICQERYGAEEAAVLNCSHILHTNCLKNWIDRKLKEGIIPLTCPEENCDY